MDYLYPFSIIENRSAAAFRFFDAAKGRELILPQFYPFSMGLSIADRAEWAGGKVASQAK